MTPKNIVTTRVLMDIVTTRVLMDISLAKSLGDANSRTGMVHRSGF